MRVPVNGGEAKGRKAVLSSLFVIVKSITVKSSRRGKEQIRVGTYNREDEVNAWATQGDLRANEGTLKRTEVQVRRHAPLKNTNSTTLQNARVQLSPSVTMELMVYRDRERV